MGDENSNINLYFSNVVCAFSVSTQIDLKLLATIGLNACFIAEKNMVKLHFVEPRIFASIWKSGKVVCAGAQDEDEAYSNAKYVAKLLKNFGFNVKMRKYRIVNVMASCKVPYNIDLCWLSDTRGSAEVIYAPDIHPGATWRLPDSRANMKVFSTGSVTILAPDVDGIYKALEKLLEVTDVLYQKHIKQNALVCS